MDVYIQSNKFQDLAANVSKFTFVKNGFNNVQILKLENNEFLKNFYGKKFFRKGKIEIFDPNDLQSFTLLRLLPESLNSYNDYLIIDPDIFLLKDKKYFFDNLPKNKSIYCTKYNNKFRSEVIYKNNNKQNWNFEDLIQKLFNFELDYDELIHLSFNTKLNINEIPLSFNEIDNFSINTILLHTSNRMTQPWKEGLNINFKKETNFFSRIKNKTKKIFRLKYDNFYDGKFIRHPNKNVINIIENLFIEAIKNNFITSNEIIKNINNNMVSKIFIQNLQKKYKFNIDF